MSDNTGNTIIALLTGATIGAGLGLLYAPKSGKETRKQLKDDASDLKKNLGDQYESVSNHLSDFTEETKKKIEAQINSTLKSANSKTDEVIANLESELKDLRKKNADLQKKLK